MGRLKDERKNNIDGEMDEWINERMDGRIDKGMDEFKNGSSGNNDWENLHGEDMNKAKLLKIKYMTISWLNT